MLMVKHRAANLTYRCTLTIFGHNPYMETMVSFIAALKELCVLKHIIAVILLLFIVFLDVYILNLLSIKEKISFFTNNHF